MVTFMVINDATKLNVDKDTYDFKLNDMNLNKWEVKTLHVRRVLTTVGCFRRPRCMRLFKSLHSYCKEAEVTELYVIHHSQNVAFKL